MVKEKDLIQQKIIPVYSHAETVNNKKMLKACYDAGLRCFEFTNRHINALEEFISLKKYCDAELPEMMLGVGTIKNVSDAKIFLNAGTAFLVSPLISNDLIDFSKRKNILWVPGCATASEVGMAENAGIKLVKIFPAKLLGGADFIKALKGPYPSMDFMVTGGISGEIPEVKKYLLAGASAIGIGNLFFLEGMDTAAITEKLNGIKNSL